MRRPSCQSNSRLLSLASASSIIAWHGVAWDLTTSKFHHEEALEHYDYGAPGDNGLLSTRMASLFYVEDDAVLCHLYKLLFCAAHLRCFCNGLS